MRTPAIRMLVAALLPLSAALAASGHTKQAATGSSISADEAYITECERDWAASVATGDSAAVERCLADDFVGVDPEGKSYDKPTMVTDTRNAPKYFSSNHLNDVKIRVFGDTAVAQGNESWQRQSGERGRFAWTDTWLKRNGTWQIVAAEDLIAPELEKK